MADRIQPLASPTNIDVTPSTQYLTTYYPECSAIAYWEGSLSGGSGTYTITHSYGDGSGGYFTCGNYFGKVHTFRSCSDKTYYQSWKASSTGGGTDYDYTKVYYKVLR